MKNRIIVCQTGSRHRYIIPQILEEQGLLYRLYTDTTYYSFCGKIAKLAYRIVNLSILQRIINRKPNIKTDKIFSTDILLFKKIWYGLFNKDSLKLRYLHYNGYTKKCISWDVGKSDCIYNMYIENYDFIKYAKSKGLKIIVDIYENPLTYNTLISEIQNTYEYSDFSHYIKTYTYSNKVRMHYLNKVLQLADFYTVPSLFVERSISSFKNFNKEKVYYLPYASSLNNIPYKYKPIKHKIIWVGNDPIRKGLIYCSKSAAILKTKYPDLDFRIIGSIDEKFKQSHHFNSLNFIGTLNKEELINEYRTAEVYVFPTLSEGMAGTIIEAASCGCPIITTDCSGMSPDFPAIFIKNRDINAIVENVVKIFENPKYRDELSKKIYDYSSKFDVSIYTKKLTNLFHTI